MYIIIDYHKQIYIRQDYEEWKKCQYILKKKYKRRANHLKEYGQNEISRYYSILFNIYKSEGIIRSECDE